MRLTRWEGRDDDGPRAVLVKRDGPFAPILQEALRKLARYEDMEERLAAELPRDVMINNGDVTEATLFAIQHYIWVFQFQKS